MIALLAVSARAGCDGATLQAAIDQAEAAFVDMDAHGFEAAAEQARATLACEHDALTPIQCAGFHRMNALEAFLHGDHANAVLYFQAVLGTQPGYELPVEIAPIGHPLRADFDRSKQYADASRFDLAPPASGWLTVDGARASTAPASRPFLFQWLDGSGAPKATAWVNVNSPVPSYPQPTAAPVPEREPAHHRSNGVIVGVGASAIAIGAGLYGGAWMVHGQYQDAVAAGDLSNILSRHKTTNVLTVAGDALMGAGTLVTVVGLF